MGFHFAIITDAAFVSAWLHASPGQESHFESLNSRSETRCLASYDFLNPHVSSVVPATSHHPQSSQFSNRSAGTFAKSTTFRVSSSASCSRVMQAILMSTQNEHGLTAWFAVPDTGAPVHRPRVPISVYCSQPRKSKAFCRRPLSHRSAGNPAAVISSFSRSISCCFLPTGDTVTNLVNIGPNDKGNCWNILLARLRPT